MCLYQMSIISGTIAVLHANAKLTPVGYTMFPQHTAENTKTVVVLL